MIKIDAQHMSLAELRRKFDPEIVSRADRIAIGRTAKKIKTQISRDVRKVYNVKARDVASTVKVLNRSKGFLEQRILLYTGGHIPLAKFDAKPKAVRSKRGPRRGVTVRVRKDSGRKLVGKRSGFHGAGFMAKGHVMARKTPDRTSHRILYGPAIPQMVANDTVIENYHAKVRHEYPIELERALNKLMGNYG
jgi:hypothetical protein